MGHPGLSLVLSPRHMLHVTNALKLVRPKPLLMAAILPILSESLHSTVDLVLNASLYYIHCELRVYFQFAIIGMQELCDANNSGYTAGTHGYVRVRV